MSLYPVRPKADGLPYDHKFLGLLTTHRHRTPLIYRYLPTVFRVNPSTTFHVIKVLNDHLYPAPQPASQQKDLCYSRKYVAMLCSTNRKDNSQAQPVKLICWHTHWRSQSR